VSYAAWAVAYSGRIAPVDWSNAKDWVSAAKNAGIPFDITPQPGDVAITTSGEWGHAMYVEQVSGNQIYVSEYNQQLTGEFSTQWRQWE
jgi:surface antigen